MKALPCMDTALRFSPRSLLSLWKLWLPCVLYLYLTLELHGEVPRAPGPSSLKQAHSDTAHATEIEQELQNFIQKMKEDGAELSFLFEEYIIRLQAVPERIRLANKKPPGTDIVRQEHTHKVQEGESIWSIAKKYKLSPKTLLSYNEAVKRRPIYLGEMLYIPSPSPHSKQKKGSRVHKVQKGDTLYSIAKKYGSEVSAIRIQNRLGSEQVIQVGQELIIEPLAPYRSPEEKTRLAKKSGNPRYTPEKRQVAKSTASYKKSKTANKKKEVEFHWPIHGKITSHFGMRKDPFRKNLAFHKGIDIQAPEGRPIKAIGKGIVILSKRLNGYGNCVFILHPQNYISIYAHNQRNLVKKNQKVRQGQHIARLGNTGRSTGPHLHLEIRKGSRAVDPMRFLKSI